MSATALPRTRRRPRRPNWTARLRRISQAVFVGLILAMSVRHNLVEGSGQTASIDALCPFGAVETLWRFITTGQFVPKTHPSNLILGAGSADRHCACRQQLLRLGVPLWRLAGRTHLAAQGPPSA